MGRHAEDALYDALRAVEGLGDAEAEQHLAAYRREVLSRFTTDLSEKLHELRMAWQDDDGRVLPHALPIFNLVTTAMLEVEDRHNRRDA